MHLIELYSTASGLTIDSPFIYESYFPLPFEKYMLVHASSGQPAKNYDYFDEALSIVRDTVMEKGFQILQIGAANDTPIRNAIDLRGKTDFHQTAYLIKRASLLLGNDSCNIHIASGFDIPLIGLYGSTSPKNSGPYFGDKSKQAILEADRKGKMPSFQINEMPKTINTITPETVAQSILDLLEIDEKINRETIFIGNQYNNFVLEVIMDSVIKPEFFQGSVLNARLDYLFDEDLLIQNLAMRSFCLLTDRPIKIEILQQFRQNIPLVIYDLKPGYSVDFVKQMVESGISYQMITFMDGPELDEAKLAFFDYGVVLKRDNITKETLEKDGKSIKYNSKYKTNKFLLSDNKIYLTKYDWMNKKPIKDFLDNKSTVNLEDPEFFQNVDFLYIFSENE